MDSSKTINYQKKKRLLNPYLLVLLSFLIVILVGAILLMMPFSRQDGKFGNFIDSLFTATSATCVTGACTFKDGFAGTTTFWGQLITLVMIQIGGLGFITLLTFIITLFKSKLQFKDRFILSQMVNSTNFSGVVKFVRRIILITLIIESIGFVLMLPVFFTMFYDRPDLALWYSFFHTVSAFNNAGFELFENSFINALKITINGTQYVAPTWAYYYFCSVVMILVVVGGISFLTILDVFNFKKRPSQYQAFTKIVLLMTVILIFGGAILIYLTDGLHSTAWGGAGISPFDALFQSITCRTAGFTTFSQDKLTSGGTIISGLLMLIGGSPLGTAGGIKTTTMFVVVLSVPSLIKGGNLHAFNRSFSKNSILKALALMFVVVNIIIISYIGLNAFGLQSQEMYKVVEENFSNQIESLYLYEIFSCFGTTGILVGIESYLSVGSKIILILLMYIGRLGPMTFFSLLQNNLNKDDKSHFKYVEEEFLIG